MRKNSRQGIEHLSMFRDLPAFKVASSNVTIEEFGESAIHNILKNRPPSLLVEHAAIIQGADGEECCRAEMTVTEKHCEGHYPGCPILPFAMIGEFIGQTGAILLTVKSSTFASALPLAVSSDGFRAGSAGPVFAGDTLICVARLLQLRQIVGKIQSAVYRGEETVAEMGEATFFASQWPTKPEGENEDK